jgi:hypothetical protein
VRLFLVIDGGSRTVIPLIDSDYFLAKGEGGNIFLATSKTDQSLLRITRGNEDIELETLNTSDEYHLFAMFKFEDRFYFAVGIPARMRVKEFLKDDSRKQIFGTQYISTMSFCFGQSSQGESEIIRGVETKLVKIDSDEKPSCTLGPFQVVGF